MQRSVQKAGITRGTGTIIRKRVITITTFAKPARKNRKIAPCPAEAKGKESRRAEMHG